MGVDDIIDGIVDATVDLIMLLCRQLENAISRLTWLRGINSYQRKRIVSYVMQTTVIWPDVEDIYNRGHGVQRYMVFSKTLLRNVTPHLIARSTWFHSHQILEAGDLVLFLKASLIGGVALRAVW